MRSSGFQRILSINFYQSHACSALMAMVRVLEKLENFKTDPETAKMMRTKKRAEHKTNR